MGAQKVITFPVASHNRQPAPQFNDLQGFGAYLRAHRERRRITLAQIALDTKLIVSRLEGLERGVVDPLPPGIYRRALVRAYASAVGLDPEEMVAEFQKLTVLETALETKAPELPLPTVEQIQPEQIRERAAAGGWRLPQALGSIAAGLAVGAAAITMNSWSAAPVQVEGQAAPAAQSTASATAGAVATTGQEERAGTDVRLVSQDVTAPVAEPVAAAVTESVTEPVPALKPVVDSTLRITSYPSGARVTVNGIGWGFTPLAIPHLPPGAKVVRVSKDGFSSAETTVTLGDNRPASVSLNLQASETR